MIFKSYHDFLTGAVSRVTEPQMPHHLISDTHEWINEIPLHGLIETGVSHHSLISPGR